MYILYNILGEKARFSTPHSHPIPRAFVDGTRASYTLYSAQIPHKILLRTPRGVKIIDFSNYVVPERYPPSFFWSPVSFGGTILVGVNVVRVL